MYVRELYISLQWWLLVVMQLRMLVELRGDCANAVLGSDSSGTGKVSVCALGCAPSPEGRSACKHCCLQLLTDPNLACCGALPLPRMHPVLTHLFVDVCAALITACVVACPRSCWQQPRTCHSSRTTSAAPAPTLTAKWVLRCMDSVHLID